MKKRIWSGWYSQNIPSFGFEKEKKSGESNDKEQQQLERQTKEQKTRQSRAINGGTKFRAHAGWRNQARR